MPGDDSQGGAEEACPTQVRPPPPPGVQNAPSWDASEVWAWDGVQLGRASSREGVVLVALFTYSPCSSSWAQTLSSDES